MNERMDRLTEERNNCLQSIQEYRAEIARLTDPNSRGDLIGGVNEAMSKVSEYIANNEDQRNQQMMMISRLMKMLDTGTKRHPKQDSTMQTTLNLVPNPLSLISYTADSTLNDLKLKNLTRLLLNGGESNELRDEISAEESIQ